MERKWKQRFYEEGDRSQIVELFRLVFEKEMGESESDQHWDWENKKNTAGLGEILLAVDGSKIVGQYAVIPVAMKCFESQILGTLSLDTMVHPDYRGQRMFPILAESLYENLGKKSIPITFGFPNENSARGFFTKLAWKEIATPPIMAIPVDTKEVIGRVTKSKVLSNIGSILLRSRRIEQMPEQEGSDWKIEELETFGEAFDDIFARGSRDMKILTIRDSKYLNWRYFQKPEFLYHCFSICKGGQTYGYAVTTMQEKLDLKLGILVDYFSVGDDPDLDGRLITFATDFLNYRRAAVILAMMFPHTPYYPFLRKVGYRKIPRKMFPQDLYFGARINNDDVQLEEVCNEENWYLTWGDSDVV